MQALPHHNLAWSPAHHVTLNWNLTYSSLGLCMRKVGDRDGLYSSDLFSWNQMISPSFGACMISRFVVVVVVLSAGEVSLELLFLEAGVKLTFHVCHHLPHFYRRSLQIMCQFVGGSYPSRQTLEPSS